MISGNHSQYTTYSQLWMTQERFYKIILRDYLCAWKPYLICMHGDQFQGNFQCYDRCSIVLATLLCSFRIDIAIQLHKVWSTQLQLHYPNSFNLPITTPISCYIYSVTELEMEVLFEVDGSRKIISMSNGTLVYEIKQEIEQLGKNGVLAYFLCVQGEQPPHKNVFILQRWNSKWKVFVDVTDVYQVVDDNRLTITSQVTESPSNSNMMTISSSSDIKNLTTHRVRYVCMLCMCV